MPPLSQFQRIDVRRLLRRGEEPLAVILQRVNDLKADEGLTIIAPFLPSPLIERLRGEGFEVKIERGNGSDWIVYFWRRQ
jgi:uncharacterized protein (DUF2249 family)